MLKRAVAQTELPLARTIDADYVAKKAVVLFNGYTGHQLLRTTFTRSNTKKSTHHAR
ncbi:hypothetical protein T4D_9439 [Trichinella pseudospiralis]|uniref:Uncharacterized protein n=1 Tax=Trichinella pseudospiralis TaxID=6337 RepID=A0A0V1DL32_TRIPS|nr:hypothetical protein T4D_9439 [Trichinella pseudospiralis]